MDYYENLFKNYDFLITPRVYEKSFLALKNFYPTSKIQILSLNDLASELIYKIDPKAQMFLWDHANINLAMSQIYLSLLGRVPILKGASPQIRELQQIESLLKDHNLIQFNPYFVATYQNANVIVYGYHEDNLELNSYLQMLNAKVTYLSFPKMDKLPIVNEFENVRNEIDYAFNAIIDLLNAGVSSKDIKLVVKDGAYSPYLKQASREFNLPINLASNDPLTSYPLVQNFFIEANKETFAEQFKEYLLKYDQHLDIIALANLINQTPENLANRYEYIYEKAKLTNVKQPSYHEGIDVINYLPLSIDSHIFVLGFLEGIYPYNGRDSDYLSDVIKAENRLNTSQITNNEDYELLSDYILSTNKLYLSYPQIIDAKQAYPSPLVNDLKLPISKVPLQKTYYNEINFNLQYAALRDQYFRYREVSENLPFYKQTTKLDYRTYDHAFTSLNIMDKDKPRRYSYSGIKSYFECPYRYYLEKILKLDPFESSFFSNYGSIAHEVLEKRYRENFDFDVAFNEAVNNPAYEFTPAEQLYLGRLKEELAEVVNRILIHDQIIKPDDVLLEYNFSFPLTSLVTINGKIDKTYIKNVGKDQVVYLIDYKTGNEEFNAAQVPFGASLQLPIYALAVNNDEKLKGYNLGGLFIQKILTNKYKKPSASDNKTLAEYYSDLLKLKGPMVEYLPYIEAFDSTYTSSQMIKSMKMTDKGFGAYTKLLNATELEQLLTTVNQLLIDADEKIVNNEFPISPLRIDSSVNACQYCPFKDICYMSSRDIRFYSSKPNKNLDDVLEEETNED